MNQVRFHDEKKNTHDDGLKAEIEARGYKGDMFASKPNITALKKKLKELMIEQGEVNKMDLKDIKFFFALFF